MTRRRRLRGTAAWRLSVLSTVAFAAGTALAFSVVDLVVEQGILERSDDWLVGEIGLLAQVVETTPLDERYETFVEEIAELASREVAPPPPGVGPAGQPAVFFLATGAENQTEVWVGPGSGESFATVLVPGERYDSPRSIGVAGWTDPFRVMGVARPGGGRVYLGYVDYNALALRARVRTRFVEAWLVMIVFGFLVSGFSTRRILRRIDRITDLVARAGGSGLDERVPVETRDDEIARLATTFNGMLDRVESSVEQTRTVTDEVAHDLRSPLTAMRGNLEMALTASDPSRVEEAAAGAIDGVDRLLRVINASLDVAEAEAGALRLARRDFDLGAMAAAMVEFYRPAAEEHGLLLTADVDRPAIAPVDPNLSRRALGNLLDNTIQHLPRGCKVRVGVRNDRERVVLRVCDSGPGFAAEQKVHAFERFFRRPGSTGHGLGLALVRAVASAHGGEALILDSPLGGACIEMSLPRRLLVPSV
ncbi:MAG: sensor histidine kinase [Acidobacteriota bacterium]